MHGAGVCAKVCAHYAGSVIPRACGILPSAVQFDVYRTAGNGVCAGTIGI